MARKPFLRKKNTAIKRGINYPAGKLHACLYAAARVVAEVYHQVAVIFLKNNGKDAVHFSSGAAKGADLHISRNGRFFTENDLLLRSPPIIIVLFGRHAQ